MTVRSIDIGDNATFALIPPCADERFDHRTCDYWEDAERGSKARRESWLAPVDRRAAAARPAAAALDDNPFAPVARRDLADNPFAMPLDTVAENPFAPKAEREHPVRDGVARKLTLLDRGRGVFGSYAKVLLVDDEAVAYCQFGPLSAYPRATRLRDLYPQLPQAPLPAVITCIASTADARAQGYARRLADEVCVDLAERGFAAVEAYPDLRLDENETSGARPGFWETLGFVVAVDDERFPVMRREL